MVGGKYDKPYITIDGKFARNVKFIFLIKWEAYYRSK